MASVPRILQFEPIQKAKIWGSETWLLSDFGSDLSTVVEPGTNLPSSFRTLYQSLTESVLGKPFLNQQFPLLIKTIQAKQKLSVQVHPDDEYASKYDPESAGKKECWMVLAAEPNAELVIGFDQKTDKDSYESLVKQNKGEEILRKWKVQPGDVFLLNPGTIHAIGSGVTLLELQQSSDSTYRVYDYGRLGDNGKPRDLHLEKALAVLNFNASDGSEKQIPKLIGYQPFTRYLFTSNEKFRLELWKFAQSQNINLVQLSQPHSFGVLHVIQGSISSSEYGITFKKNDTIFLSADSFEHGSKFQCSKNTDVAFMGSGTDWVEWL